MQPKGALKIEQYFINLTRLGEPVELGEWKLNFDKFLTSVRKTEPERFRLERKYHRTSAQLRSAKVSERNHPG